MLRWAEVNWKWQFFLYERAALIQKHFQHSYPSFGNTNPFSDRSIHARRTHNNTTAERHIRWLSGKRETAHKWRNPVCKPLCQKRILFFFPLWSMSIALWWVQQDYVDTHSAEPKGMINQGISGKRGGSESVFWVSGRSSDPLWLTHTRKKPLLLMTFAPLFSFFLSLPLNVFIVTDSCLFSPRRIGSE